MKETVSAAVDFLRRKGFEFPVAGIIQGTGLTGLSNEVSVLSELNYSDIPGFPAATVEFHSGRLVFGTLYGKPVVVMKGRFHYYEGHSMSNIVFPLLVMKELGIQYILVSNASGALNPSFRKGELMVINDHINLLPEQPSLSTGMTVSSQAVSFYDTTLSNSFLEIAKTNNITIHNGVYASVPGPMLETRAEYRYLRRIGADAVGMSTVPEVIAAYHLGIRCAAISVLTDECDPDNLSPVSIEEIIETAKAADINLTTLFKQVIEHE